MRHFLKKEKKNKDLLSTFTSNSESPFSEPGALEDTEPDAGTETQTSDEGTWSSVAVATAAMATAVDPPPPAPPRPTSFFPLCV